jgi:hypothetical protein
MRKINDPRQARLVDPFQGLFAPAAVRILQAGWQGLFRHAILARLPVAELSRHFHRDLGTPTKELYSMAGLVFLADFQGWTAAEAAEAYMFRTDVQYALNLEPGAEVSARTVERYQQRFRDDDLAAWVFDRVTADLVGRLELDATRQRLDSTHLFSRMATFGRTRLMAVAVKRFLVQVKRHDPAAYVALPEPLRLRYEPAQSQLFAAVASDDAEVRRRARRQAAEDLLWVIDHFADRDDMAGRPSFQVLRTIFAQQCEVVEGKVELRAKPGGECIQNPSDPEATYDGHKGPGYQVQIAETCAPGNEVQLITAAEPQTACETDESAVTPMLDQLEAAGRLPEAMLVDAAYANDANVQAAAARGVELVGPITGRDPQSDATEVLTIDDFAVDERTGVVEACPAGRPPLSCIRLEGSGKTKLEMAARACVGCPFRAQCPITCTPDGRYVLKYSDHRRRLAERRREQQTDAFKRRYAMRSGIESTNSGLKNRLGLGVLPVRGRGSVFRMVWHKLAGWNLLRAAAAPKLRAWLAAEVAATLRGGGFAPSGLHLSPLSQPDEPSRRVLRHAWRAFAGPAALRAA